MNKEKIKEALIPALKRALWTIAQTAIAMIPIGARIAEVDWLDILSVCAVAGILSLLKSIVVGMPEAEYGGTLHIDTSDPEKDKYLMEFDELDGLAKKTTVQVKIDPNAKLDFNKDIPENAFGIEE